MRYENIYSSFPCPASGHFSAASGRVAPIRGSVFLTSSAAVQQFETSLIVFALHDDLARTCKILNLN